MEEREHMRILVVFGGEKATYNKEGGQGQEEDWTETGTLSISEFGQCGSCFNLLNLMAEYGT